MAVTIYEIADIVTGTQYSELRSKATNIDSNLLRSYPYANKIVRKSVVREQGGLDVSWRVNVAGAPAADNFVPFQTFTRTTTDHLKTARMQLRGTHADFSFDIMEEEVNQGKEQLINVVDNREQQAMISLTAKLETQGWGNAAYGDDTVPQGFLYWLPYASGAGDFVGTYPTSYTDVAGLNPNTYTGWKSYGGAYVAVTPDDLILKLRLGLSSVQFMSPLNTMIVADYSSGFQFAMYAGLDSIVELENLAKLQNDDIGNDLDKFHNVVTLRGIPFLEVPFLRTITRRPIIGANWGVTKHHVQAGMWMNRMKAPGSSNQPTTVTFDLFCQHQLVMYDRRTGGFNFALAA